MIITTLYAGGRETIVEYSPEASWKSWGIETEGRWDTHVFLGKFSLVHTNHWQRPAHFVTKLLGVALGAAATTATASALGLEPVITGAIGPF